MVKLNTNTSVVDYLKSKGQDSSFNNRAKLAQQYGIKNYTGTASQNIALLNALKSQQSSSSAKPSTTSAKPVATPSPAPSSTKTTNSTSNSTVQPVKTVTQTPKPTPSPVAPKQTTPAPAPAPAPTPSQPEQYFVQPQPMLDLGQLTSLLQPPQPRFDISEVTSQFNDMFTKLQSDYNSRLEAMQRMLEQQNLEHQKRYDELMNKLKYNQTQLTPTLYNSGGDGISLFGNEGIPSETPANTSETPVGYRQSVEMNDALLRYMQNLWGGGF